MLRMNHAVRPPSPTRTSGAAGVGGAAASNAIVRPLKTSEVVARDVVRDITARHLTPGESLPPENAMREMYGVSRQSLREGLRLLEVQGLISIRRGPGGGPTVAKVDPADLGRVSTLTYHMAGVTYRELLESWSVCETMLAERAARHPDREARRHAMEPYVVDGPHDEESLVQFIDTQVGFHVAVGRLARNKLLELMLQTIGTIVSHHIAVIGDPREFRDLLFHDHRLLARAIIDGHARRARALMESHINGLCALHEEAMGSRADELIEWL
jgi:GntR family transcriptional repressor for pyruvate dehydrogenase complex